MNALKRRQLLLGINSMSDNMKGQILDIHQEGGSTFRGCIIEEHFNHFGVGEDGIRVVNLDNGETKMVSRGECDKAIIENVLTLDF
jgi:hypothetical protein